MKKYIYIICAVLFLSACKTQKMFTTLDVLRPAEITFAPGVKDVLIVNNSVVQPYNVGHLKENSTLSETVKFDSAALFCNASLRENLESKEFFNSVNMAQTNQNKTDNFYKITTLDKENVKFLCGLYKVDAVISLDHIQTEDNLGQYYSEYSIIGALDVKVVTTWSVHYPGATASTFKQFTDEFSWEDESIRNLPTRYDALVDASIMTGSNVADRMIPRWEKQERYFFTPKNSLMNQAMDSVSRRNWKGAIALWKQAAEQSKNNTLKFRASNNIAIAYEILGDLDNALEHSQQAVNLYPYVTIIGFSENDDIYNTIQYNEFLKKRKEEVELIKKQLSEI